MRNTQYESCFANLEEAVLGAGHCTLNKHDVLICENADHVEVLHRYAVATGAASHFLALKHFAGLRCLAY